MPRTNNDDSFASYDVYYCGFSVLDFNFSAAAFRWIVGELIELLPLGREKVTLSLTFDDENKKTKLIGTQKRAERGSERVVLEHDPDHIWKIFRWPDDCRCFAYLIRTNPDFPFTCHVFTADSENSTVEIASLLCQVSKRISNGGGSAFDVPNFPSVKSVPVNCSPSLQCQKNVLHSVLENFDSSSSQFEVLYLCRVEIDGSPSSFIVDEAVKRYDGEYRTERARHFVAASVKRLVAADRNFDSDAGLRTCLRFSEAQNDDSPVLDEWESPKAAGRLRRHRRSSFLIEALVDSVFVDDGYASSSPALDRKCISVHELNTETSHSWTDLVKTCANSNRSMLMCIGRSDITLISLTTKEKLLQWRLTEISYVVQGSKYANHFGFVCPDLCQAGRSQCFVIRCQDSTIADSVIRTMRTAFTAAFNEQASVGGRRHACDRCPLYQYSCLCSEMDGLQPRDIHDLVVSRINRLSPAHQDVIWNGYKNVLNECKSTCRDPTPIRTENTKESNSRNIRRKNVMLMSVLRSVCENAQILHSRSVGKLFNGGDGNGTSKTAGVDDEIYLTAADGLCNAGVGLKGEKVRVGTEDSIDSASLSSSSSSHQRFSAVHKLVSLRDRAKNAFGGSLDSFIKRKLHNYDDDVGESALTLKENLAGSSEEDEAGDDKESVFMFNGRCGSRVMELEEMNYHEMTDSQCQLAFSPAMPPSCNTDATSLQATFHFDTPGRRGSEGDLRWRPRSSTVGETWFTSATVRGERIPAGPKQPIRGRDVPLNMYGGSSERNSSLTNMTHRGRRMSWRQAILSRVVSPRLFVSRHSVAGLGLAPNDSEFESPHSSRASVDSTPSPGHGACEEPGQPMFYKSLWKKAIMEQILTLRLDNKKKLRDGEPEEMRSLKLTYEEITPCSEEEVRPIWLTMLNHPKRNSTRFDRVQVEEAVKAGVPPDLRHEVWKFLLSQHMFDRSKRAQMETPPQNRYQDLLKDLTSYQHAILIDLGRTFPSHQYFSQPLGSGQLSLFNILKAYSLFDPEVGYCQGLSFVAGVLLLHMEEEDAFEMLAEMMFRLQLRRQYRPDMMALQIEMYQLSRLLHDRHKDLHVHLEEHEIPVLYAAPWFLTLFASAFPLGFVARVFDFVFLAGGLDVVFKIALILLGDHKELIKHCDSFESISEFLKTTLPSMSIIQMERVFNQVVELDVSRELLAYEVEYHVLQEEVIASPVGPPPMATFSAPSRISDTQATCTPAEVAKLQVANKFLKRQNMELLEQLQQARHQIVAAEKGRSEMQGKLNAANDTVSSYQCKVNVLESRLEALEMERKSLLSTTQRLRSELAGSNSASTPVKTNAISTMPRPKKPL